MIPFALLLAAISAAQPLIPSFSPGAAVSLPAHVPGLQFLDLPWDTNALADSLDTSNPPDGALTVARAAGPDSSVIILAYNYNNGGWYGRISRSTDGGKTYTPATVYSGFFVDDVMVANGRDSAYLIGIIQTSGYHLYLKRSTDGGDSWSDTIRVDRGTSSFTDKPMAALQDSFLYCTYTDFSGGTNYVRMCYSSDYGATWNSGDVNVTDQGGQGSCPATGPEGNVYVVWGQPAVWVPTSLWFGRSTDHGATWSTPYNIDEVDTAPHMLRWRANHSFPAMKVDANGKIYVTVQNSLQGEGWDVAVYTSVDSGNTWLGPFQVNDDTVIDSDQFCSWITIDRYNRPHVFWYDNRDYYPTASGDVYYSWSEDGGVTWQPNERVNDVTPVWTDESSSQMGDFQQIECDTNFVYCQWSDHRNDRTAWSYIAAARRPLPSFTAVAEEKPQDGAWQQSRVSLLQNTPNPVVSGTAIRFQLETGARADLKVYDLSGKLVRSVLSAALPQGSHTAYWDCRDDAGRSVAAGVYYYSLRTGETSVARRMVVSR